jgi:hypothetical protein
MNEKSSLILDGISKVTKFVGSACERIPIVGFVIGIIDKIIGGLSKFSKTKI